MLAASFSACMVDESDGETIAELDDDDPEGFEPYEAGWSATPAEEDTVLAPSLVLATPSGGVIGFFYDDNDHGIVLAEKADRGTVSYVQATSSAGGTPLDLYLALSDDEVSIPEFLVVNHRELRGDLDLVTEVGDRHAFRDLYLAAENDPLFASCNGNACLNPGYTTSYCEFDVPYNQTRSRATRSNNNVSWPTYARLSATACNLGATVTVTLRYRSDTDCGGPTGGYTSIGDPYGFPSIDDQEAASYGYFGTAHRFWNLDKSTTTSGSTDLSLHGKFLCPEG